MTEPTNTNALYDFSTMPLTPAQETVVLLKAVSAQLDTIVQMIVVATSPKVFAPEEQPGHDAAAERKAKIEALQARVPVAKRK